MASKYGQVAAASKAELVLPPNPNRCKATLVNLGTGNIFVGTNELVTTQTGFPVGPNQKFKTKNPEAVYVITALGTAKVGYWEDSEEAVDA